MRSGTLRTNHARQQHQSEPQVKVRVSSRSLWQQSNPKSTNTTKQGENAYASEKPERTLRATSQPSTAGHGAHGSYPPGAERIGPASGNKRSLRGTGFRFRENS